MARPKKNTVDYFPHDCHWSKELEIFVNKHGNEGYAFYYRLLELLGVTPNHKYDCSKQIDYQYLVSKTEVTEEKLEAFIECLISIGVIDKELWKEGKIWIQSFVDSVAEVYKSRTSELPTKEGFLTGNYTSAGFPAGKQGFSEEKGGFLTGNSQSKLNNTKKEESVVKESTTHTTIDLNTLATKYPTVDVEPLYETWRLKQLGNDKKIVNEAADFEVWCIRALQNGWDLKPQEEKNAITNKVTLHCPKCRKSKEVTAKEKVGGVFCCEEQMVEEYELTLIKKE